MASLPTAGLSGSVTPPDEPALDPALPPELKLASPEPPADAADNAEDALLGTKMFFSRFPELPDAQLHDMLNAFKAFDPGANGHVRPAEVAATLRRLDLVSSKMMMRYIIEAVDEDGDGEIDLGEFIALMGGTSKSPSPTATRAAGAMNQTGTTVRDGDEPTKEEKQEVEDRRKAMAYFYRGVATIAFNQMSGAPEVQRQQLLRVLETEPDLRTQWELQRLLIWCVAQP